MEKPLPVVLALVVADLVYHDDISSKPFILGVRSVILGSSFPCEIPRLAVYAAVVEGRGTMTLEIRLIDADEERTAVYEAAADVTFRDPLTEVELTFEMKDMSFPQQGDYRLQMRVDGRFLCERRLWLVDTDS